MEIKFYLLKLMYVKNRTTWHEQDVSMEISTGKSYQHRKKPHCSTFHCDILYCNTLHYNTLHCNTLHCNTLYCSRQLQDHLSQLNKEFCMKDWHTSAPVSQGPIPRIN